MSSAREGVGAHHKIDIDPLGTSVGMTNSARWARHPSCVPLLLLKLTVVGKNSISWKERMAWQVRSCGNGYPMLCVG